MAHSNIDDRRYEVKAMLDKGLSHSVIKATLSQKFDCHKSAIHADILHFKTEGLEHTIHLSKAMREKIYSRDGKVCQYCGSKKSYEYIIEHIIPSFHGGVAKEFNLTVACQKCNTTKRRQVWTPLNIDTVTKDHPDWREKILEISVKDCRANS